LTLFDPCQTETKKLLRKKLSAVGDKERRMGDKPSKKNFT